MSECIALYLHIPFCRRKCGYCSFSSYPCREADIPAYLRALKAELTQRTNGETVRSIYFGGGTPSLLSPEQVSGLLTTIRSLFAVDGAAEITMEANPGTIDEAYLKAIKGSGVKRLSLGVQSLNDKELGMLGRIHTADEARQAVQSARNAGFENLNLDLIYGLPGQSLADWQKTLEETITLNPEHLSLYALTLEEDTPMCRAIEENRLPAPDADLSADQYELAEGLLAASGYQHYEISNWAKEHFECRHNLVYWHNEAYLGAGVAAHSSLNCHRLANTSDLDKYLSNFMNGLPFSPEIDEEISPELQLAETVILGLRLGEGVNLNKRGTGKMPVRFGGDIHSVYHRQIKDMTEAGLLDVQNGRLKLTTHGRLLSNEVFWRLLPAET